MINVHLSQRDKSIMPKATRGTNLNMHEFGIRSRVGSGLHEELVAIEKNDWQDADEGGVLLIACEEDFTRK